MSLALFLSQTPTLLLTPSPLLSNIHFWSTLSPVAPLSPATRRQGGHLFQVNITNHTSLYIYSHLMCLNCLPSFILPSFLVPVCTHASVPDTCSQHGWDQHTWSNFSRSSENLGQQHFFPFLIILVLQSQLSTEQTLQLNVRKEHHRGGKFLGAQV